MQWALTCEKFCQRFDEMQSDQGIQNIFRLHCSVGLKGRQKSSSKVLFTVTGYKTHRRLGAWGPHRIFSLDFLEFLPAAS